MFFIVALIVGAGLVALAWWLNSKGIKLTWYEWLIGVVGLALLLFAIQNYFGFNNEMESNTANMFLLAVGLPSLILVVVAGVLPWMRSRRAS